MEPQGPPIPPSPLVRKPILHPTLARAANRVRETRGKPLPNIAIEPESFAALDAYTTVLGKFRAADEDPRILLNPSMLALDDAIAIEETLAHELAHADQRAGLTREEYIWELAKQAQMPYREQPWEQEAIAAEQRHRAKRIPHASEVPASLGAEIDNRLTKLNFLQEWASPMYDLLSGRLRRR